MNVRFIISVKDLKCNGGIKMLQFTNGFTCVMNQDKGELFLTFVQQIPEFDEDGNTTNVEVEEVVKLAMGKVMAQNLVDGLNEVLTDDDNS